MSAEFLIGFTAFGCLTIAVFFLRFWKASGDRFFIFMASAFLLLALNRIVLGFLDEQHEARPAVYVLRLVAFAGIVVAILDKDRRSRD